MQRTSSGGNNEPRQLGCYNLGRDGGSVVSGHPRLGADPSGGAVNGSKNLHDVAAFAVDASLTILFKRQGEKVKERKRL